MITGSISGLEALSSIADRLNRLARPDLQPLGERIRGILINDNREALLAGIDGNGQPFAPLATSTQRHRQDSDLPGSCKADAASVFIKGFEVQVEPDSRGQVLIGAGWSNSTAPQAPYFDRGTVHQPPRQIAGIRPETQARVETAVNEFAQDLIDS